MKTAGQGNRVLNKLVAMTPIMTLLSSAGVSVKTLVSPSPTWTEWWWCSSPASPGSPSPGWSAWVDLPLTSADPGASRSSRTCTSSAQWPGRTPAHLAQVQRVAEVLWWSRHDFFFTDTSLICRHNLFLSTPSYSLSLEVVTSCAWRICPTLTWTDLFFFSSVALLFKSQIYNVHIVRE